MKTQTSPKTESKSDSIFPRAPIPLSAIRDFRPGARRWCGDPDGLTDFDQAISYSFADGLVAF